MKGRIRRAARLGAMLAVLAVGEAKAGSWADVLFAEKGHDFGPVPRGAKVRHAFTLKNTLGEAITILDVHASCGCTTGKATATTVPPGGSATIEAEMDTRNFVDRKVTALMVSLVTASGKQAEVRLGVASTILSDIVLNPGTIDFGNVARGGQGPRRRLTVERLGGPGWKVERMVSKSKAIDFAHTHIAETARSADRVLYTLTVALRPDAPAGPVRDEIRIRTNDREAPSIPVLVTAHVEATLSASPSILALGQIDSAAVASGKFLVRGSKPFAIAKIEGTGDGFEVTPAAEPARKALHVLNVSYHPAADAPRGDLHRTFRVVTDLPDEPPLELHATLRVGP
ncbi:MAG TPA: DUF1573 domain-containing protein [Isosphaeraceae bacterium]|jgi:hypothetical protein|nr:DUF1573 domain-containing protein [Isosphaeraceae bacterium]